jgi:hypothetical protein
MLVFFMGADCYLLFELDDRFEMDVWAWFDFFLLCVE